jgi:hypothetical protein
MRTALTPLALLIAALGAMFSPQTANAKGVIETYESGQVKAQYILNDAGQKDGIYQELYEDGQLKADIHYKAGTLQGEYRTYYPKEKSASTKPALPATRPAATQPAFLPAYNKRLHVLANYTNGKLMGKYAEFDRNNHPIKQAIYLDGKLHGAYVESEGAKVVKEEVWFNGELLYPRSVRAMALELAAIDKLPVVIKEPAASPMGPTSQPEKPKAAADNMTRALHCLMRYRYLCGVPYQDLFLTEQANKETQAAAEIVCALGHLTHTPEKPAGWADDKYELGHTGAGHSNLSAGRSTMEDSIHSYMNDSDNTNVDRVGHRRWCLNPAMSWTGFGQQRTFVAMYSLDCSRPNVPDWDFVAYPSVGLFPVSYFGAKYAWSVSINEKKYTIPDITLVKASVTPVKGNFKTAKIEAGEPLGIEAFKVSAGGFGSGTCIIFRPMGFKLTAGQAYRVEITGLQINQKEAAIRYITEFCDLPGSKPSTPSR